MASKVNDVLDVLVDAASRGVEVTVLTNAYRASPPLTLNWRFWDTNDSGWGEFRGAGYLLKVRDCDGDFTHWYVKRGDPRSKASLIAEGTENGYAPYHFDAALLAAEAAFRADVRQRLARLRGGAAGRGKGE